MCVVSLENKCNVDDIHLHNIQFSIDILVFVGTYMKWVYTGCSFKHGIPVIRCMIHYYGQNYCLCFCTVWLMHCLYNNHFLRNCFCYFQFASLKMLFLKHLLPLSLTAASFCEIWSTSAPKGQQTWIQLRYAMIAIRRVNQSLGWMKSWNFASRKLAGGSHSSNNDSPVENRCGTFSGNKSSLVCYSFFHPGPAGFCCVWTLVTIEVFKYCIFMFGQIDFAFRNSISLSLFWAILSIPI